MSATKEACALCGVELGDRVMALVEWTEPIGNTVWSYVPRCEDRAACRERVELVNAEAWPVNDRTPVPAPRQAPLEVISLDDAPDEPFHHPEPDPPAPEPEEAGSWLG